MAWTSGFFNSVNGDRTYNAQQMSSIFEGLITDGVYASVGNKLAVQPASGMTIRIRSGRGWFNKHWVDNDTDHLIALEPSDVTLNRYAAVCIRVDEVTGRNAEPYIKYSSFATNPVKPSMERTETVKEYCLAYVYIRAGVSAITAANIEDTRGNTELCGWVTGLIEQLSTTTLFEQWTALFNDWFVNLQDHINENTEAMLVNALPTATNVSLSVSGWSQSSVDGTYSQTVGLVSMNATKIVILQPAPESVTVYSAAEVKGVSQGDNTLTFSAMSLPSDNIIVNVISMGV